jgi:hydroxymethylpyrimidine/phosphomethylpyrimidine kinase
MVRKRQQLPVALTIAGSDSGGGAGIQADLKTFAALGVHGTSAVTCLTAQNPKRVMGVHACRPPMVRRQLEAVFAELRPAAAKTGMLYSAEIIHVVAEFFRRKGSPPLVVDPVMTATSGTQLLRSKAVQILQQELLPLAAVVTPNVDEAAVLARRPLRSVEDLRAAAREICHRFHCAALVKGGHLRGLREAVDIFYDGQMELLLTAPFIRGLRLHGTGCAYSAAITAFLARGHALPTAVTKAKEHITQAIAGAHLANGHAILDNLWHQEAR